MKNLIEIKYIVLEDGTLFGWAEGYKGTSVKGKNEIELKDNILDALKGLFNYMISRIDSGEIETEIEKL